MSDFGLFEAATDAEQAPRRREMIAARQMSAALSDIHTKFGPFITAADGLDTFDDRWLLSKKDILRILQAHKVGAYPAVVREVHGSLKSAWYAKHGAADGFVDDDDDKDRTITDKQKDGVDKGDREKAEDVDTNSGDGSDASGKKAMRRRAGEDNFEEEAGDSEDSNFTSGGDSGSDKTGRRRVAEDRDAPIQQLQEGREHNEGLLIPDAHNDPTNPESAGVQRDFGRGGDTGTDGHHREAMQLVADLYNDFALGNNLRVASMDTLDVYAAHGLHDDDYYLLASLIRKAEEDCDCPDDEKGDDDTDTDGPEGPDKDTDGPPQDSDSGSGDESDSSSDDSDGDSDGDSESSGSDESSSGDDSGNPFAGGDDSGDAGDSAPADDGGSPFGNDLAVDDAPPAGGDVPPEAGGEPPAGPPGAEAPPEAGPPGDVGAPPDAAGQSFDVPQEAPPLPPQEMDQLEQGGAQSVPPEVIDDILGLPPGTLEALITEELNGGGGAPPSGSPPGLTARRRRAWLGDGNDEVEDEDEGGESWQRRNLQDTDRGTRLQQDNARTKRAQYRRAAEDPTEAAGSDPAAAAQPQMPAAPPAGAGSAGTMPPPGSASVAPPPPAMPLENQPAEDALLDTALQSVTQMIDTETQEYQQIIDPLTNALQAIQFAQQVEQAENPLDVTPPEGTVDASPSAAPDSKAVQAWRIAKAHNLSVNGYKMLLEAMSRKHYEHVGEAIRTLPPELRGGVANHIGAMFREDNPRFNHDKWMESVGAPRIASSAPFVIRSQRTNGGRTAGWMEDEHRRDLEWRQQNPEKAEAKDFSESADARGLGVIPRTAGENLKNTPTLDAFEFPGQGEQKETPRISDNNKLTDLPKMKGAGIREAKDVMEKWDAYNADQTEKGLNVGGDAEMDQFAADKNIGPRAIQKLKNTVSANRRAASFFTRRVPGWDWDDHLAGYVSKEARAFTCSCGEQFTPPSYGTCRCGKIWNSYAIGDGTHLAGNAADMFITREIPVRDDVIVANRKMVADDRGYENFDPYGKGDTEWKTDEERENASAPHAPGQTASRKEACWPGCHEDEAHAKKFHGDSDDDKKTASLNDAMSLYERHFNTGLALGLDQQQAHEHAVQNATRAHQMWQPPAPAAPQPSLKDRVRQHLMDRMQRSGPPGGFAGGRSASQDFFADKVTDVSDSWVKYDDEDPARKGGPSKPPSTKLQGGDPKWHSRGDQGKFKSTTPFKG